jgi:Ti-type conjugative transfer relaxase TraA
MAIQFASVTIVKAGGGGSAVGLSAYMERCRGRDAFTGQSYNFETRGEVINTGLHLPDDAPEWMRDRDRLWNEATAAEYVKDRKTGELRLSKHGSPQVAKSYVLALPKELSNEQNSDLVRTYVEETFGEARVAVQWAVHADHKGSGNIHAHLLVSTRRVEAEGFGKKARELNPEFAKGRVSEPDRVGEKWAEFQNRFFHERGIDVVVDPTRLTPDLNAGTSRFVPKSEIEMQREALAERNREQARDPEKVLAHLTKHEATFTERQLDKFLAKSGLGDGERELARKAVLSHSEIVRLEDVKARPDGSVFVQERLTLRRIIEQEKTIVDHAQSLRARAGQAARQSARRAAQSKRSLTAEQQKAFDAATGAEGLAIIQGRAGTGKSYTANAIREAYETDGYRVIGLAPTNTVAADMRAEGFKEGRTLASEMMRQQNQTEAWDRRTVVLVDEMAMLSSNDTERLLAHANYTGAKIIGFGDDRQLASIERGGMFTEVATVAQVAELVTVTRQQEDWQREASGMASRGDFKGALEAYSERGVVRWTDTLEEAYGETKARWIDEQAAGRNAFVYAATNDAVDRLNAELRQARIDLGQIKSEGERTFKTEKGERRSETTISIGDRIQFNATVKDRAEGLELRNGEFGTVIKVDGDQLRVHLDSGRFVNFDATTRRGWALGYAGTTYKGQGKTNQATILLYDNAHAWKARGSYVNLTRHKEKLSLVVPRDQAKTFGQLVKQMQRDAGQKAATSYRLAPAIAGERSALPIANPQQRGQPVTASDKLARAEKAIKQERERDPEKIRNKELDRDR